MVAYVWFPSAIISLRLANFYFMCVFEVVYSKLRKNDTKCYKIFGVSKMTPRFRSLGETVSQTALDFWWCENQKIVWGIRLQPLLMTVNRAGRKLMMSNLSITMDPLQLNVYAKCFPGPICSRVFVGYQWCWRGKSERTPPEADGLCKIPTDKESVTMPCANCQGRVSRDSCEDTEKGP